MDNQDCIKGFYWTEEDDRILRHLHDHQPNQVIADLLGRSRVAVGHRARKMGLRKPDHFRHAGRFVSGQKPWNKGKSYQAGGRSHLTQFRKGHMAGAAAHNYRPVGSVRVSRDNYLERKVTDDPSRSPARRWVGVHRLVWKEAHGPIPRGHIVVFKRGMRSLEEDEITIDRLECISRRENMLRNSAQRHGPEIFKVIQLRGALNRRIRNIEREQNEQQD